MTEEQKFGIPEIARILRQVGNGWLILVALGFAAYVVATALGEQRETLPQTLSNPVLYLLLFIALAPGIGMKLWAQRTVRRVG